MGAASSFQSLSTNSGVEQSIDGIFMGILVGDMSLLASPLLNAAFEALTWASRVFTASRFR